MTKHGKILTHIFLILVSALSVFPLLWMIVSATNKSVDILRGKLTPGGYFIENLRSLMQSQNLGRAMYNSFRNAFLLTFLSVLICSIAGYGFEIYHSKWKDRVMGVLLLAMMVPFIAIMIPLFKMVSGWKLINTLPALLLPSLSTPFLILMFRQGARSFPDEIIEAARLDGVTEIGIYFRMFVPIMKSTFGAAITVTFMSAWNSYLWPLIVFQKNETITMPLMVSNLMGVYETDYGQLMLGVLMCTLPTAIIFLCLQRSFTEGITGSVKG